MSENTWNGIARVPDTDELGWPQKLAPDASVRIPTEGLPLLDERGRVVGHVGKVHVQDGQVVLSGTISDEPEENRS